MVFRSNRHVSIIITSIFGCIEILSWCSFGSIDEFTFASKFNDKIQFIHYTSYSNFTLTIIKTKTIFFFFSCHSLSIVYTLFRVCVSTTERKQKSMKRLVRGQTEHNNDCHSILVKTSMNKRILVDTVFTSVIVHSFRYFR